MAARRNIFQAILLNADLQHIEERQRRRDDIMVRRNDITDLPERKFLERYRISKAVALKVLDEIQERLDYPNQRNFPLLPMQQLLIALRYYASGSFQLVMADNADVSKATVSRTIK